MKKIFIFICFFVLMINVNAERFTVEFSDCVDGDTFKVLVDGEVKKVRMLAIDTPETVKSGVEVQPYGKEASDYTCNSLKNAKVIELEYDENSDKTDKYDRLLAWVYVDDNMLQKDLLSLGYAKTAYIYGKYSYLDELYKIEKQAAADKKGIWSEEEYVDNTTDTTEDETTDEITESFKDELSKLIKKYIDEIVDEIIKDIKKEIKSKLKEVFE